MQQRSNNAMRLGLAHVCHKHTNTTHVLKRTRSQTQTQTYSLFIRATFTSTIHPTIGKCGHKSMAVVAAASAAFVTQRQTPFGYARGCCYFAMHKAETDSDADTEIHVCVMLLLLLRPPASGSCNCQSLLLLPPSAFPCSLLPAACCLPTGNCHPSFCRPTERVMAEPKANMSPAD